MSESLISTTLSDSGRRVVNLKGDLDLATAAKAGEVLSGGFDVLDLSELAFLDSSGLRVLLQASQDRDPAPILRGVSGQVKRILELSGVAKMFVIEEADRPDGVPPTRSSENRAASR